MSDRYSAEFVVSRLREAGIAARMTAKVEPSWTMGSPTRVMPVEVRVPEAQAEEARRLLAEEKSDEPPDVPRVRSGDRTFWPRRNPLLASCRAAPAGPSMVSGLPCRHTDWRQCADACPCCSAQHIERPAVVLDEHAIIDALGS